MTRVCGYPSDFRMEGGSGERVSGWPFGQLFHSSRAEMGRSEIRVCSHRNGRQGGVTCLSDQLDVGAEGEGKQLLLSDVFGMWVITRVFIEGASASHCSCRRAPPGGDNNHKRGSPWVPAVVGDTREPSYTSPSSRGGREPHKEKLTAGEKGQGGWSSSEMGTFLGMLCSAWRPQ